MGELYVKLAAYFKSTNYTWKIGGKQQVPTADDLEKAIDSAVRVLNTEGTGSQLEVGRLIVRHWSEGKFDVYVYAGSADQV